jgi:uncharacterized protein YegL
MTDYGYGGYDNYSPDAIGVDEVINVVFVVDVSSSVTDYANELDKAFNDFKNEMASSSKLSGKVFVSTVLFASSIKERSGFQPVTIVPDFSFSKKIGGTTALYLATKDALENAILYRDTVESGGVNAKTLLFVITDGEDNASPGGTDSQVKAMIDSLNKDERSYNSFYSILFGVGPYQNSYQHAKDSMGFHALATLNNSAKDIRRMINIISASVSSMSSGQQMPSVDNF